MVALTSTEAGFAVGHILNPCGLWVFSSGSESPGFDRIREQLASSAADIPALRVKVIGGTKWTYPRWSRDSTPPADRISEISASCWDEVLRWLETVIDSDVDPAEEPWRIRVIRNVRGVPGVDGVATVLVTQHNHAIADGLAWAEITRHLLGGPPTDVGPSGTVARVSCRARAAEVACAPVNLIRMLPPLIRLSRRSLRRLPAATDITRRRDHLDRWIRMVPVPVRDFAVNGTTITTSAAFRAAVALERYGRRHGMTVGDVVIDVPTSVRAHAGHQSTNAVFTRPVDARMGETDDQVRLDGVASDLRRAREFASGPDARLSMEVSRYVPAFLAQVQVDSDCTPVVVSSYRRSGPLQLVDDPCVFSGGSVGRDDSNFAVRAIGYGDTVCVTLTGNRYVIDDPDEMMSIYLDPVGAAQW